MPPPEATLIQRSDVNEGPVRRSPSQVICAATSHRDGAAGSSVIADVGSWAAAIDAVRHAASVMATTRVIDPPLPGRCTTWGDQLTPTDVGPFWGRQLMSTEACGAKVELE